VKENIKIEVTFQIWGEVSEEKIEKILQLKADSFHITRAGNPLWEITTGLNQSEGIAPEVEKIMKKFKRRKKKLISLKKNNKNIEYTIDIRIDTYNNQIPELWLSNDYLLWSGQIGATTGISIYQY
jgi:hypothetical protein